MAEDVVRAVQLESRQWRRYLALAVVSLFIMLYTAYRCAQALLHC